MRVNFFQSETFDFVWPSVSDFPEEEKVTLHCKRLSHSKRVEIENGLFGVDAKSFERGKSQNGERLSGSPTFRFNVGSLKWTKILGSVKEWSNVLDESGDPVKMTETRLQDLITSNAGLPTSEVGHLETELITEIDMRNNFADRSVLVGANEKKQ